MRISLNLRVGWVGRGYHPDFFTHWLDLWIAGIGVTFQTAHVDSVKLKEALRRLSEGGGK